MATSQSKSAVSLSLPTHTTITVGTGLNKKIFQLPTWLIRKNSLIFNEAFVTNPTLTDIKLRKEDPDTFQIIIQWMTTSTLPPLTLLPPRNTTASLKDKGIGEGGLSILQSSECIKSLKDILKTEAGKKFRAPVTTTSPAVMKEWNKITKKNIDLFTIIAKFKEKEYRTLDQVEADIELLYDNNFRFYGAEHATTKAAGEVRELLRSRMPELRILKLLTFTQQLQQSTEAIDIVILATKFQIEGLHDVAMDRLVVCGLPSYKAICQMYERTGEGTIIREFLVRCFVYRLLQRHAWAEDPVPEMHILARENKELGVEVWRVLDGLGEKDKVENPLVGVCEFHEHGKEAVCSIKGGKRKRQETPDDEGST